MLKSEQKVFIITINWNGLKDTLECLESLEKITYKNKKIIVIDNGSENNEADIIKKRFPRIHLIKLPQNTGFTGGCNTGMKFALQMNANYILLINNDTVVANNFLEPLVEQLNRDEFAVMVSPKILYYKSNKIWSMGGKVSTLTGMSLMIGKGKSSEKYQEIIEPDFLTGCALLVETKVINKIGLLNPIYFAYYEDVEWSYKTSEAGYYLKVIPDSIIWHKKSASTGNVGKDKLSPVQAYYMSRNGIIFGFNNLKGLNKLLFLLSQVTIRMMINLVFFTQNNTSRKRYLEGILAGFNTYIHI